MHLADGRRNAVAPHHEAVALVGCSREDGKGSFFVDAATTDTAHRGVVDGDIEIVTWSRREGGNHERIDRAQDIAAPAESKTLESTEVIADSWAGDHLISLIV